MGKFKSGFVTIIGRPNVGKSTLLNYLIGEKLSIISSKPQTTRNNIQAILTKDDYQIVFIDTPGMHKPRHKLGEYMVNVAKKTLEEVDLVLFLTNPDEEIGAGDKHIIEQLKNIKTPVIMVLNKIDTVKRETTALAVKNYSQEFSFKEIVPLSARTGENVDTLLNLIVENIEEGPQYFPKDMITDQPEKFIISEIIREKILKNMEDEIPHGTAVEVMMLKENEKNGVINIHSTIYCEKESHKSMLIGKNGSMIKKIGESSRMDIEKLLDTRVYLELWVKVKKDWRDNTTTLKNLGYY